MKRNHTKRLKQVASHLAVVPLVPEVVDQAFETFQETGELPEHQRVAEEVIQRALRPFGRQYGNVLVLEEVDQVLREFQETARREAEGIESPEDLRRSLFYEALSDEELVRFAAREAIKVLVGIGQDVAAKNFVPEDIEMPDFGTVGLHLFGFPEMLAKPPYVKQARRLFERIAELRQRIDQDDRSWFERLYEVIPRFRSEGFLPEDELMREAVLVAVELNELTRLVAGHGDAALMAELDRVALAAPEKRVDALASLRRVVTSTSIER